MSYQKKGGYAFKGCGFSNRDNIMMVSARGQILQAASDMEFFRRLDI